MRRSLIIALVAVCVVVIITPRTILRVYAQSGVYSQSSEISRLKAKQQRAAIVLGAGLVDKRPSPLLDDRVRAAIDLLEQKRVDVLIMSGDNTTPYYDEPTAMRTRALELGVSPRHVAADYGGRRTWDTCVRARKIFGVKKAVIVTSSFHIDRAVASCRAAHLDAIGLAVSDRRFSWKDRAQWRLRELAASARAVADIWWLKPDPAVLGERVNPWDPCSIQASLAPSDSEQDTQRDPSLSLCSSG